MIPRRGAILPSSMKSPTSSLPARYYKHTLKGRREEEEEEGFFFFFIMMMMIEEEEVVVVAKIIS